MRKWVAGALVAAVVAAMASTASAKPSLTNISIQLQWVPQAQFAGYYAALDLGYYKAAGLNVKLLNGGPQIVPGQVVASGRAQFVNGLIWNYRPMRAEMDHFAYSGRMIDLAQRTGPIKPRKQVAGK